MEKFLGKYASYLYATMRVVFGFLFASHGAQKLFGWFGGEAVASWTSMMGIAGIIELVAGLCMVFGFLTSYAAFVASGQMAAAYFMVHFPQGFWPIQNGGELAVLYCFAFLYIAARGAVICGVDRLTKSTTPARVEKPVRRAA